MTHVPEHDPSAKKRVRAEMVTRIYLVALGLIAATALVLISVVTMQNAQRGAENRETLHTIKDCTQPSGVCYQRGQAQTAQAVSGINQSNQRAASAAAACAAKTPHPSYRRVYRCVIATLR